MRAAVHAAVGNFHAADILQLVVDVIGVERGSRRAHPGSQC